jgi:hypothetical protein
MGLGSYSQENYTMRSMAANYKSKAPEQIFTQRTIHDGMSPFGVKIRESRDSEDHPNSVAIMFGMDVTGSAGDIPKDLVVNGLPTIMSGIIETGIPNPQLLFMGIGDHKCDRAPLQVSQFESSDELLEKWLTKVWIEHGGGGNGGESYSLAHYFAAYHTSIDCFEKRRQKGFLFTIGDEPTHRNYPGSTIKSLFGVSEASDKTASELLTAAREKYEVYHFHLIEGSNGRDQSVVNGWKEIMGDHLILIEDYRQIPSIVADIVYKAVAAHRPTSNVPYGSTPENPILGPSKDNPPTPVML